MSTGYTLAQFIEDLRAIAARAGDDREIIRDIMPLARQVAEISDSWLKEGHYRCDEEQGFGVHLLHEEPDHSLAVFAASWLPGRGAPPHDHGTWAVVAGVDGEERNVNWLRHDDGSRLDYAEVRPNSEVVISRGKVISYLPRDIHSVVNDTDRVSVSFHVYGKHVNHTGRSQFDPDTGAVERMVLKTG